MKWLALLFAVAVAAGFWAGRRTGDAASLTRPSEPLPSTQISQEPTPQTTSLSTLGQHFDDRNPALSQARMWREIENLDAGEVEKMVREILALRALNPAEREMFRLLLERWRELDPHGAAAALAGIEEKYLQSIAIAVVLIPMAETDYDGARQWLAGLATPAGTEINLIGALAKSSPERAASEADRYLEANPPGRNLRRADIATALAIAQNWAASDLSAAAAWAAQLPDPQLRRLATEGAFHGLIDSDPSGAAATIAAGNDASLLAEVADRIAHSWGGRDWDAATSWALALPPGEARLKLLTELGKQHPDQVMTMLEKVPEGGQGRTDLALSLASRLAGKSPGIAFDLLEGIDPSAIGGDLARSIGSPLAGLDAPRALTLANGIPDPVARGNLTHGAIRRTALADGARAVALLDAIADSGLRAKMATEVADVWGAQDFTAALAWVLENPGGSDSALFRDFLNARAQYQAQPVAKSLVAHFAAEPAAANDPSLADATGMVAGALTKRDADAAAAWALALPAGYNRSQAIRSVSSAWRRTDAVSHRAWIANLSAADRSMAGD